MVNHFCTRTAMTSFVLGFVFFALTGCAALLTFPPPATTTTERLKSLQALPAPKFRGDVTIYWDKWQIPFIKAEYDTDAAFALGLVHAHLRLGQMEFAKRVASGRLSEIAGFIATDIDAALRTLDIGKATKDIVANMPKKTWQWLNAYTKGVNHYKRHTKEKPHDMIVMAMDNEPWRMEDSILLGRLGSADVNWFSLFSLLPERSKESWPLIWQQYRANQKDKTPSFKQPYQKTYHQPNQSETLKSWLQPFMRSGSNSIAVAAKRSKNGAALLANDPHLGFSIPNLWLIAGLHTPSYNVVGMMPIGIPIFALGRNPHIAWGGTNMRQWSSDIVDVSDEKRLRVQKHRIKRRFLWDSEHENDVSAYGPIISDADILPFPEGKRFAVRWVGHQTSDEITAMLHVMQAQNGQDIRKSLSDYALPGQNLLFADKDGHIGHFLAAWIPKRPKDYPDDLWVSRATSDAAWQQILTGAELPYSISPPEGVLASSNNKPTQTAPTRLGWNFPQDDRITRIYERLAEQERWSIDDLKNLQLDSYSTSHHALCRSVVRLMADSALRPQAQRVLAVLQEWDGYYRTDSKPAYVYQGWLSQFAPRYYQEQGLEGYEQFWWQSGFLAELLKQAIDNDPKNVLPLITETLEDSLSYVEDDKTWGSIHRVAIGHFLRRIPLIGSRYHLYDLPIAGSSQTILKSSGTPLTTDKHFSSFGSQARHLSDMSSVDANYFILFGGQDGTIHSENFVDQVPLWAEGKTIQVPLTLETFKANARYRSQWRGR